MIHIEKLVPEVYKESRDFRVFLKLLDIVINSQKYDIDNWTTLYDPSVCKDKFLPLLADMIGYRYDINLSTTENRIIMKEFNSMIKNKGSEIGLKLAATLSLNAQLASDPASSEYLHAVDQLQFLDINCDYKTGVISIFYPSDLKKMRDLFKYVRPVGSFIELMTAEFPEPESELKVYTDIDFTITDFTNKDYTGSDLGPKYNFISTVSNIEELNNYDTSGLNNYDSVTVLVDSEHENSQSSYYWDSTNNEWVYIDKLKINLSQITRGDFLDITVNSKQDLDNYDTYNIAQGMIATVSHDEEHSNAETYYEWTNGSWSFLDEYSDTVGSETNKYTLGWAWRNRTDRLLGLTQINNYNSVTVDEFEYTPSMIQELKELVINKSTLEKDGADFKSYFDFDNDGKLTDTDLAYLRKLLLGIMTYSDIENEVNNS